MVAKFVISSLIGATNTAASSASNASSFYYLENIHYMLRWSFNRWNLLRWHWILYCTFRLGETSTY
jgi:hypothetical protein